MNRSPQSFGLQQRIQALGQKKAAYWSLIKSKQSFLLLITGWAGFSSAKCPVTGWALMIAMLSSLLLAICGSTVLNMVIDRDIDKEMPRTAQRPLAKEELSLSQALVFGLILSLSGISWAFVLNPVYGVIVSAGLLIDVLIYSLWLKRRTAYSIIWGGFSGGMPILAGRMLGLGRIDLVGVLLALAILLWIPTHIMTFNMKYAEDYARAGVPTFPARYGVHTARLILAWSTVLASIDIVIVASLIGIRSYYVTALIVLGLSLVCLATVSVFRPSPKLNLSLFKAASTYMLGTMLLIALAV